PIGYSIRPAQSQLRHLTFSDSIYSLSHGAIRLSVPKYIWYRRRSYHLASCRENPLVSLSCAKGKTRRLLSSLTPPESTTMIFTATREVPVSSICCSFPESAATLNNSSLAQFNALPISTANVNT